MSHVFVLDALPQPLTPVHPGRARLLLTAGKAAVYRTYPFTIMLKRPGRAACACPAAAQDRSGRHHHRVGAGGRRARRRRVGRRSDPSGRPDQAGSGHPARGTPRSPIPQDPLSSGALGQSEAESRVVTPVARLTGGEHPHLGHADQAHRARDRALARTGALRSAKDGGPRDQWRAVSTGNPVRVRTAGISPGEVEPRAVPIVLRP